MQSGADDEVGWTSPWPAERAAPPSAFANAGCLADEEIVLFLEGAASREHERRLKEHIDACAECREAVAMGGSQIASRAVRR